MLSSASIGNYFKFQLVWILAYARMTMAVSTANANDVRSAGVYKTDSPNMLKPSSASLEGAWILVGRAF